jgi:hypothetical protein
MIDNRFDDSTNAQQYQQRPSAVGDSIWYTLRPKKNRLKAKQYEKRKTPKSTSV